MKLREIVRLFIDEFSVTLCNDLSDYFGDTVIYRPYATDYSRENIVPYLDYTVVCIRENNEVVIKGAKLV